MYLTFDDGPTAKITDWTLDILDRFNAKASFFCIGNNIEKHPDIFRRIEKEGHAIGNHTFNHPSGWDINTENYISEVQKTQEIIDALKLNRQGFKCSIFSVLPMEKSQQHKVKVLHQIRL